MMGKVALAVVCLAVLTRTAVAQPVIVINQHWITDNAGCKIWDSRPVAGETVTWTGSCVDGFAEGMGTLTWYGSGRLLSTYQGELRGGHYAGRGAQMWPDGARYDGDWSDELANGQGTYRAANGEVCSGAWVKGCFQGFCGVSIGTQQCPAK